MFSSCHKLLFIKRMCLIGVAFYEPDLDRLESMWNPDIFGEMMATNNTVMQVSNFGAIGDGSIKGKVDKTGCE